MMNTQRRELCGSPAEGDQLNDEYGEDGEEAEGESIRLEWLREHTDTEANEDDRHSLAMQMISTASPTRPWRDRAGG
jgi:hypothetical protein